jgi:hypothetical protein
MFEVREVLRVWLGGVGLRAVARLSRVDRKTVRRYVDAAIEVGVTVDGGVGQWRGRHVEASLVQPLAAARDADVLRSPCYWTLSPVSAPQRSSRSINRA